MNKRLSCFGGIFDLEDKKKRLQELELAEQNPAVWADPSRLEKINKEKSHLQKTISEFAGLEQGYHDAKTLLELATEARDEAAFDEVLAEVASLKTKAQELEIRRLLSGEQDPSACYLSINAGAGGTESCDWANMLLRMYTRYAQFKGWSASIEDLSPGEEAGIKSVTLYIDGPFAYGMLKGESGVHRLVRISPFDANARRHTSFASVFVWPEVDDEIEIVIRPEDLRVETFRASGAGGQHVNRTDSAVRMYHIPTGIVVACQTQRSQIQNRERALKMLKAALYQRELEERQKAKAELAASKKANEWGSQIRSYVLHPYQLVKDHRSLWETSAAHDILEGEEKFEELLKANLKWQAHPATTGGGA